MLAIIQRGILSQFSTRYQLLKGKYLVHAPPKRPPTPYLLYSQEARKSIQGESKREVTKSIRA